MQNLPELCHYAVCIWWETVRLWELSVNRAVPSQAQSVIICDGVTPWLGHSRLCCLHHCEAHAESLSSQGYREGQSLVLTSGL